VLRIHCRHLPFALLISLTHASKFHVITYTIDRSDSPTETCRQNTLKALLANTMRSTVNKSVLLAKTSQSWVLLSQLKHLFAGRFQASSPCQLDTTPTKPTPQDSTPLFNYINIHKLTAFFAKTLGSIGWSKEQDPMQEDGRSTNQPTNKKLPVEVWMHIFEYISTEEYARPAVAAVYKSSVSV
jgi:hypothetical protein